MDNDVALALTRGKKGQKCIVKTIHGNCGGDYLQIMPIKSGVPELMLVLKLNEETKKCLANISDSNDVGFVKKIETIGIRVDAVTSIEFLNERDS